MTQTLKMLVVDDEEEFRKPFADSLRRMGHEVQAFPTAWKAWEWLAGDRDIAAVFLDAQLSQHDLQYDKLLERINGMTIPPFTIIITGHPDRFPKDRVIQQGADEYLRKVFKPENLKAIIERARGTRQAVEDICKAYPLLGHSVAMQNLRAQVRQVAHHSGAHVLLRGDRGTGKECVARHLWVFSPRRDKPLWTYNCGVAESRGMLQSQVFGHVKGSFTTAIQNHRGLFQVADGGTLFLDELGELPREAQDVLLRAIEYGEIQVVGSSKVTKVDVRVIAATNVDLDEAVEQGRFSAALLDRLGRAVIRVPPLRRRGEDIAQLAEHFFREEATGPGQHITPEAMEAIKAYDWPGNVRQLKSVCAGLAGERDDVIQPRHVLSRIARSDAGRATPNQDVLRILRESGWNRARAYEEWLKAKGRGSMDRFDSRCWEAYLRCFANADFVFRKTLDAMTGSARGDRDSVGAAAQAHLTGLLGRVRKGIGALPKEVVARPEMKDVGALAKRLRISRKVLQDLMDQAGGLGTLLEKVDGALKAQ